jgi:hypothetical protein
MFIVYFESPRHRHKIPVPNSKGMPNATGNVPVLILAIMIIGGQNMRGVGGNFTNL